MYGEIDSAITQRLLEFLGEQSLAADLGERAVLDHVAAGPDRHDRDRFLRYAVSGSEPRLHFVCLP